MSVKILFDKPSTWYYTNLDFVTGKVILILQTEATISAINVKLEGESRTRLAGPRPPYNERSDKKRTETELHKLLYKVVTVFPTPDVPRQSTAGPAYTLAPGHYEYPFRFKFPFNNSCSTNSSIIRDLKVGGMRVEFAPDTNTHVKKALPPTLSGFPGEADIQYYIKATVVRPKFYQENLRFRVDIKFLPIEPPRPPDRREETFARRKQQFAKAPTQPQRRGLFWKSSTSSSEASEDPPSFQVDARLPNPAIITCNEPLPLRILVKKLSESSQTVYLGTLQIELFGYTHVRAHDLSRSESSSWVLMSLSNMGMPLGVPADPIFKEWKVPARLWENIPLPNTVAPSFDTCNISRTYELEVRVGLAHGGPGAIRPELIVLPLRLPVTIYSGIKPPEALLHAIATSNRQEQLASDQMPHSPKAQQPSYAPSPITPLTPSYMSTPLGGSPILQIPPEGLDAPPSYEDAMAEDIAPVDGPRRDYMLPSAPTERRDTVLGDDSKGLGVNRRPSERLFPQNNVHSHSRTGSYREGIIASSPDSSFMEEPGAFGSGQIDAPERPNDMLPPAQLGKQKSKH